MTISSVRKKRTNNVQVLPTVFEVAGDLGLWPVKTSAGLYLVTLCYMVNAHPIALSRNNLRCEVTNAWIHA
jgi:hypothetical protein